MPDALNVPLPIIVDVLSAIGIMMAWADGYEADDIIATLAAQANSPVEAVTGDRDLFQLVDDARGIRVAYIGKGVANLDLMDEAAVAAKYQIPGRSYAAFAALRGDPSDGLPGVPGVGEKTAAALVRVFGVETIVAGGDRRRAWRLPRGQPRQARRGPPLPGRVHAGGAGRHRCAGQVRGRRAALPAADPARIAALDAAPISARRSAACCRRWPHARDVSMRTPFPPVR